MDVDIQLQRAIVGTIENINIMNKRCATYKDLVGMIGINKWSPETITRATRTLVETGVVKRWRDVKTQQKATFYVVSIDE